METSVADLEARAGLRQPGRSCSFPDDKLETVAFSFRLWQFGWRVVWCLVGAASWCQESQQGGIWRSASSARLSGPALLGNTTQHVFAWKRSERVDLNNANVDLWYIPLGVEDIKVLMLEGRSKKRNHFFSWAQRYRIWEYYPALWGERVK